MEGANYSKAACIDQDFKVVAITTQIISLLRNYKVDP